MLHGIMNETGMYEFCTVVFMQLSVGAQTHTLLYRQTPITAGSMSTRPWFQSLLKKDIFCPVYENDIFCPIYENDKQGFV